MPDHHDLTVIDRDGAIAEALDAAPGMTRGTALRRAVVAFGGIGMLGALTADNAQAQALSPANDLRILQLALAFEQLGAAYYSAALKAGKLRGDVRSYARTALRDEQDHVKFVADTITKLGGKPHGKPKFDFGRTVTSQARFLRTAELIEQTCVETLNGAGPLVSNKGVVAGAGRLVSVEARQVAWVRYLRGERPVMGAFDVGIPASESVRRAKALGVVKSALPPLPA